MVCRVLAAAIAAAAAGAAKRAISGVVSVAVGVAYHARQLLVHKELVIGLLKLGYALLKLCPFQEPRILRRYWR